MFRKIISPLVLVPRKGCKFSLRMFVHSCSDALGAAHLFVYINVYTLCFAVNL